MDHSQEIATTGRVQAWLEDPDSRLPVSCTVYVCEDSMEGDDGIEKSWRFCSHALRNAAGVAVHLSKLRPEGTENGKGLVASGPVSFAKILSQLNETLRRGGTYKNGAVVATLDANHADLEKFIDATREELPWVKKCIQLQQNWWDQLSVNVKEKICKAIQTGDLWVSKVKYDQHGERIYSNVCQEIWLKHRGTCLLAHVNLGACKLEDLETVFYRAMHGLCVLHEKTGVGDTGEYLSPTVDRQVGLGVIGMANFLASYGVTYKQMGWALHCVNDGVSGGNAKAFVIAQSLQRAVMRAAEVARENNMDRAFCTAPTASCSYNYKDLQGFTACPEIAPPISRQVDRDSGTFGVKSYDYGEVETASEVGWHDYYYFCKEWCQLLESTGLFHGYSFNTWSDQIDYTPEFIQDFLDSSLTSLYYALQVMPDTLRKDDVTSILDEDYHDIFGLDSEENFCSSCAE